MRLVHVILLSLFIRYWLMMRIIHFIYIYSMDILRSRPGTLSHYLKKIFNGHCCGSGSLPLFSSLGSLLMVVETARSSAGSSAPLTCTPWARPALADAQLVRVRRASHCQLGLLIVPGDDGPAPPLSSIAAFAVSPSYLARSTLDRIT